MVMNSLKHWGLGLLKSWTAWFGALVIGLPEWWPLVEPMVREVVNPEHYSQLVRLIGVAIVLLRFKTKESVIDKGLV
jgi:hypothetical protein